MNWSAVYKHNTGYYTITHQEYLEKTNLTQKNKSYTSHNLPGLVYAWKVLKMIFSKSVLFHSFVNGVKYL